MTFQEIATRLSQNLPITAHEPGGGMPFISCEPWDLLTCMEHLYRDEAIYFDMLSCITAVDLGAEEGIFELLYQLYSIPFEHSLAVKTQVARTSAEGQGHEYQGIVLPVVPSVSTIWKTADWHEREAFDLYGIWFEGHQDMRRILLPADWEGFPMRKDYETGDSYHGIPIDVE